MALFNDHSGGLLGLDPATGKELWRTKGAMGSCTSPTRWPCGERPYVIAHGKCFDPKTGQLLWKADVANVDGASGSFAVSGEHMVVPSWGAKQKKDDDKGDKDEETAGPVVAGNSLTGVACYRIDAKGAVKVWALPDKYRCGHSSPLIYRGYAYFQTGKELVCVELKTGKIVNEEPVSNPNPCTAPIGYEGRIFMMHAAGVQLFSGGETGMKRLGQPLAPARESTIAPYVADGILFFRGPNYLYGYDIRAK